MKDRVRILRGKGQRGGERTEKNKRQRTRESTERKTEMKGEGQRRREEGEIEF